MSSRRVVVVAGGGRGIGRSVCQRFAREGARVIAVARTGAELGETASIIEADGGRCETFEVDLAKWDQVDAMMRQVAQRHGRIDVLVNTVGLAVLTGIEQLDPAQFTALLDVNVRAVYHTCRAAWPIFRSQKAGVVINLSSMSSVDPFEGLTAYGAAKAWVNGWTRGLANEGRPLGIRVYSVAPGAVWTSMLRGLFPDFPQDQALDPDEVAETVYALSKEGWSYATGQTVFVRK